MQSKKKNMRASMRRSMKSSMKSSMSSSKKSMSPSKNKGGSSKSIVKPSIFHIALFVIAALISQFYIASASPTTNTLLLQLAVFLFIGIVLINVFWIADAIRKEVYK